MAECHPAAATPIREIVARSDTGDRPPTAFLMFLMAGIGLIAPASAVAAAIVLIVLAIELVRAWTCSDDNGAPTIITVDISGSQTSVGLGHKKGALIMTLELAQDIEILERTPHTLRALLGGLSAPWIHNDRGPDDWSPFAVVGHLIHGEETNWLPRVEMILRYGHSRPFESIDRLAQFGRFDDQPLDGLLATFAQLRGENLNRLQAMRLTQAQLELRGLHPELGAVTLRQLLATWVVHDLNHLGQVAEAMSKRYADAVGPWKAYLDILGR